MSKLGFWKWWLKETILWWALGFGIIGTIIFVILSLTVNKLFICIPFTGIIILGIIWYVVPWCTSLKKSINTYVLDVRRQYENSRVK